MTDTNLIRLLCTFTKPEFRDFGTFVNSAYFNREKVLMNLYSILKKYHPEFKAEKLKKEKVYSKLFSGKKYNDALMRNTISDMLKLAERFLKNIHFEEQKFYGQYLLLKELTNRKQNTLFRTNFKLADKFLDSEEPRDEIYYQNKFLLEDEWRRNHVVNSSKILFETDNLDKQSQSLHVYYITEFIKLYAILLNQSKYTFDYKFDFALFEAVREYLEKNFSKYSSFPYINVFYNCVKLYLTGEEKYFNELKLQIKRHFRVLTLTDRKNIFIVLIKHCDEQIMKGNLEFSDEKFRILQDFIITKAYLEGNNFMAHYIYEIVADNAIECRKFEWAEQFLIKYKEDVLEKFRENSFNICMGELLFSKGEFAGSLEVLSHYIPLNVKERIRLNVLLLKIFYNTGNEGSFSSLIRSSKKYIIRNKTVQESSKTQFANFLKFSDKLFKIKYDKKLHHELRMLTVNIQSCNELVSKKWLSEEVRLLK
ncbi:MAG TPA: hypothetical protein PKA90_08690 [Ignavibacteria bacterium]|nr:hypothetical protein [Ignavibacteria bacterium]HMR40496.1 hypothetical protein [Ignavibacteria bacterium]